MLSFLNTDEKHRQRLASEGAVVTQMTVPLTTLDDLLAEHSGPIDFASIDVEGGEMDLLDGFNLDRFRPRIVMVEENLAPNNSPMDARMARDGYVMVGRLVPNSFYVRGDDAEMIARANEIRP